VLNFFIFYFLSAFNFENQCNNKSFHAMLEK